jgi:hypothetical protein
MPKAGGYFAHDRYSRPLRATSRSCLLAFTTPRMRTPCTKNSHRIAAGLR